MTFINSSSFLKTNNIIIRWEPRSWKTTLWAVLSLHFDSNYFFWNVELFFNWIQKTQIIQHSDLFNHLPYLNNLWLIILDELWKNFNSKEGMSQKNKNFQDLCFTAWKHKISLIWISQRLWSIPIDLRETCSMCFYVDSYILNWQLLFNIRLEKLLKPDYLSTVTILTRKNIDLLWLLNFADVQFNTREDKFFID